MPAYGAQVHHAARDWADNGQTNVDELGLACGPDNRVVGPGGWATRINGSNDVEWIPSQHLDTGQARVNDYHRPERLYRPPDNEPNEPNERGVGAGAPDEDTTEDTGAQSNPDPPNPTRRSARANAQTILRPPRRHAPTLP